MQTHSHGHGLVDNATTIKETLKTQNHQLPPGPSFFYPRCGHVSSRSRDWDIYWYGTLAASFLIWFFILRQVPAPHHAECLCINVERTGTCVVCPLQTSLTGASLSLPHVLRDILKRDSQGPRRLPGIYHLRRRDDWCRRSVSRCTCHVGSHLKVGFTNCNMSLLH